MDIRKPKCDQCDEAVVITEAVIVTSEVRDYYVHENCVGDKVQCLIDIQTNVIEVERVYYA